MIDFIGDRNGQVRYQYHNIPFCNNNDGSIDGTNKPNQTINILITSLKWSSGKQAREMLNTIKLTKKKKKITKTFHFLIESFKTVPHSQVLEKRK